MNRDRPGLHGAARLLLVMLIAAIGATSASAQSKPAPASVPSDLERLIREGLAEQVEAKFIGGGSTYDELRAVAAAYANRARRQRDPAERKRAFEKAEEKYERMVKVLQQQQPAARLERDRAVVRLAAARVEYGSMLLGAQALEEIEQGELSNGEKIDRARLGRVLTKAREQFEAAEAALKPMIAQLSEREDELLTAGVYGLLQQTRQDGSFRLAWCNLYYARFEAKEPARRQDLLQQAAQRFATLIEAARTGTTANECYLGQGLALRELGDIPAAEKALAQAMQESQDRAIAAQARYELARTQILAQRFELARATLRPLAEKDAAKLDEEDRPARFYVNLAQLWDANSYLLEAESIRKEAETSSAKVAILQKAQRVRELGLAAMKRLADRGGSWPGVVRVYLLAGLNLKADPKSLSPLELFLVAGHLLDAKRFREAEIRLREAVSRPDIDADLRVRALMDLARAQDKLNEKRSAAATYQAVASQHKSAPSAPQAAALAFKTWAEVATRSKQKEDYQKLAETLLNLVQSYPNHELRDEALWWLPVAHQAAGRYDEAAAQFGTIPESSARYDEAQFRRALCQRLSLELSRGALPTDEYRQRAAACVTTLIRYGNEAHARALKKPGEAAAILRRAAEARVNAAELLVSAGVEQFREALDQLKDFEQKYPGNTLVGRALGTRIRAHRGLREFDDAANILQQFLQSVSADQAGAVLTSLARGMQDEVERLRDDGQLDAARQLAAESVGTFVELEKWVRADAKRAQGAGVAQFGRAQMLYFAGQLEDAAGVVEELLRADPRHGNAQRLRALLRTARCFAIAERGAGGATTPEASTAQPSASAAPAPDLQAAEEAWAVLLADPSLRTREPGHYWEARYNWLRVLLAQGRAKDVESAIRQDSIWHPDLGGPEWSSELRRLYAQSAAALNLPTDLPTSQPSEKPGE